METPRTPQVQPRPALEKKLPAPLVLAAILAISNAIGFTLRTSNSHHVSETVRFADCYDLAMGAGIHPLNNCAGNNPIVEKLKEARKKM